MSRLLALLLVLSLPLAWAQDETEPETSETPATTKEPATKTEADDPFDYQSSEQISEDLSVSFPVDI